jgi:hypothetical protein
MQKIRYAFVLCGAFSNACYAQMTWYPPVGTWSGPTQSTNELIMDSLNQNSEGQSENIQNEDGVSSATSLTYISSKSRTRINLQNFVGKTRAIDPAGAAQMEQLFAENDILGLIGGEMRKLGLNQNNAADAFAVYWVTAWQVSKGDNGDYSPASYQAVAAQAARGLAASPQFDSANDAQKQEMAEALMVQAALLGSAMQQAASDPAQMKALSRAVSQGASASGLDLDKMTLTENGFVPAKPRKRSDASDVAGEEKALAANDTGNEKDEGLSPTQLAMIAAAGGAGLGAVFLLGKVAGKKG